jgi:hypothetical protein
MEKANPIPRRLLLFQIKGSGLGAGLAQLVACWPGKCKALSSNTSMAKRERLNILGKGERKSIKQSHS